MSEDRDWTEPPSESVRAARRAASDAVEYAIARRDALYPDHVWVKDLIDGTSYCRRCLLPSAQWGGDKCPDEWAVNVWADHLVPYAIQMERQRAALP